MKSMTTWITAAALLATCGMTQTLTADDRTAEEIIEDISSVVNPPFVRERARDKAYRKRFFEMDHALNQVKAAHILELYQTHPDHESVIELMPIRWGILVYDDDERQTVEEEMAAVITSDDRGPLVIEALYWTAHVSIVRHLLIDEPNPDGAVEAFDAFIAAAPEDHRRGADLLIRLARAYEEGSPKQRAIYVRLIKNFPDAYEAKYVNGKLRRGDGIGKPFELEFTDAITGTEITMAELKGQVVVIDFWAVWCGPCVAEMPRMKELYATYHEKGVQFLGISLDVPEDQGGLDQLKNYVADNEIAWPQYYQGADWAGEFSVSWGINGIPALFIVDKQGNLHSTKARGELETLIPELLAK